MSGDQAANPSQLPFDPNLESLTYQLELLKVELDTIEHIWARLDEITQTTKNWAILTWGGSMTIMLADPTLRKYIMLSAVFPLLFWIVEAQWRSLQRRSAFRRMKIGQFLNDGRLVRSFESKKLADFYVFDPVSKTHRSDEEYKSYISFRHTLTFPNVFFFYLPLLVVSVVLGLLFLFIL